MTEKGEGMNTYQQAIREAKERYASAMDDAAADALLIVEEYGKPLATVCKDIAGDGWNALRVRCTRLRETAGQSMDELARARAKETQRKAVVHAKSVLKDPEQAAALLSNPAVRKQVNVTLANMAPQPKAAGPEARGIDLYGEISRLEVAGNRLAAKLPDFNLDKSLREELADHRDWHRGMADVLDALLAGSGDLDEQLQQLLEEGAR